MGSRSNSRTKGDYTPPEDCGPNPLVPRWENSRRIGIAKGTEMQLDAGREDGRRGSREEVERTGCTHSYRNGSVPNHGCDIVEKSM